MTFIAPELQLNKNLSARDTVGIAVGYGFNGEKKDNENNRTTPRGVNFRGYDETKADMWNVSLLYERNKLFDSNFFAKGGLDFSVISKDVFVHESASMSGLPSINNPAYRDDNACANDVFVGVRGGLGYETNKVKASLEGLLGKVSGFFISLTKKF